MANPYVFLVGCPRSGTTLLQRMADAHPGVAIIPEAHWILRCFEERTGLTPDGLVTPELHSRLLELPKFMRLGMGPEQLPGLAGNGRSIHYTDFVREVFDLYGKARGKELVGNKTPGYVRKLHALHTLWPGARFVHLIRDGRDVCLSVANWRKTSHKPPGTFSTWKDDAIATTALWWEGMVQLGRQAGHSLGPELYYEMRYESLVHHPAEECAGLCKFLGLPESDAMVRFHEGRTRAKPGLDAKHAWLPTTPGLRDWRAQMPAEDVERYEAVAGALLDALGYPRAFPRPSAEMLENASRMRTLLARDPRWLRHFRNDGAGEGELAARPGKEGCCHASD